METYLDIEGISAQKKVNGVVVSVLYTFQNKTMCEDFIYQTEEKNLRDCTDRALRDLSEKIKEQQYGE